MSNTCISCGTYTPIYDFGLIKYCKFSCETGEGKKCKTCDDKTNGCSSCNSGYYLPDDRKKQECEKCTIEGCEKCKGSFLLDKCLSCYPSLFPVFILI